MIKGTRIIIRGIEESDASFYHDWINDQETNFWRGLNHPSSFESSLNELKKYRSTNLSSITFTITAEDEKPIGLIGVRGICNRSRRCEIWIYLGDKSYWNKGYGQETLSLMIKYLFDEMNFHRVWLECDPEFESAVRCYEKVGFLKEGILKDGYFRRGRYRDTMIMGLIRKYE